MFSTNLPVTAEDFFNRRIEITVLTNLVEHLLKGKATWLAILGVRKIGKTSLLLEVQRRLARDKLAFVLLDTYEEMPPTVEIFRRFALRVVDAFFAAELGVGLEALGTL